MRQEIIDLIHECMTEIARANLIDLPLNEDTILFGIESELDSLDFVELDYLMRKHLDCL